METNLYCKMKDISKYMIVVKIALLELFFCGLSGQKWHDWD